MLLNVLIGNYLDVVAISLTSGSVASSVSVYRDSYSGYRRAIKTGSSVRHIGANNNDAIIENSLL